MTTAATLGRRPPCLHARKSDGSFRRLMRRVTDELVRWDKPRRAKCALLDMHESQFSRAENDLVGQVFSMDKYHDAAVAERVPDPVRQRVGPVEPVGHSYRDPDRDGIAGTGRDRQRMEDRLGAAWAAYRHAPSLATAFQVALAAVALWWMWTYPAAAPAAAGARRKGGNEVSFYTDQIDPNEVVSGTARNVGLVLWIPRDKVEAAKRELEREEA